MDILEPDSGEISFLGDKLNKKKMGYLPEARGLYEETKVMDTILYFADLNDMDRTIAKKEAEKWLDKLDLSDYKNNKIDDLSKGMQQKVQFIVSMIHKPKLLVLDELFSGLDPVNQDLFKNIVRNLVNEGTTILLSSHRMNLVEELCDRIFFINEGQRLLYGYLEEIRESFGFKGVKILTGNSILRNIFEENSVIENVEYDDKKINFDINNKINIKEFLYQLPEEIQIRELSVSNPSLHDIFVNTVKEGGN